MTTQKEVSANLRLGPHFGETFTEIEVTMKLTNDFAEKLVQEAAKRKRPPVELFADLLEAVLQDDLWTAILDR